MMESGSSAAADSISVSFVLSSVVFPINETPERDLLLSMFTASLRGKSSSKGLGNFWSLVSNNLHSGFTCR